MALIGLRANKSIELLSLRVSLYLQTPPALTHMPFFLENRVYLPRIFLLFFFLYKIDRVRYHRPLVPKKVTPNLTGEK